MKLRDLARRVGGGSGTQQPRRKKRRYPRRGGSGSQSTGELATAIIYKNVPAAPHLTIPPFSDDDTTTEVSATPGVATKAAVVMKFNDDYTGWVRRTRTVDNDETKIPPCDVWNATESLFQASQSEPLIASGQFITVGTGAEERYFFVIASDKDIRSAEGFSLASDQAWFHKAGERKGRLDGASC